MFEKVEHIGIAVKSLDLANITYTQLLGVAPYKMEAVESEGVNTSFFMVGTTKIELLEATKPDSAIATFIEKRGEGMHHIAYAVDDIEAAMQEATDKGFRLLNDVPKRGADNKLVCFVHPKDCNGVLVEFCQSIPPPARTLAGTEEEEE